MAKKTTKSKKKPSGVSASQAFKSPRAIKEHLDSIVVGQERAKRTLAVAVANHFSRISNVSTKVPDPELANVTVEKSNILMIGPTGSGKTYLAKGLAEMLQVPFCIADATSLTESGYVGQDVESILQDLKRTAADELENAEHGIVYIDEFDKLRTAEKDSMDRDVGGKGVQQRILKMIEGSLLNVPVAGRRMFQNDESESVDTTNILFICAGAFVGLEDIIAERLPNRTQPELMNHVMPCDLIKYGIIPELIGRLPVLTALQDLSFEDVQAILTEPKNALLKQYRKQCILQGFDVEFSQCAVEAISAAAMKMRVGARGLRSVVETVMLDIQYSARRGYRYAIDKDVVAGCKPPKESRL